MSYTLHDHLADGERYFQVNATVVLIADDPEEARRYMADLLNEDKRDDMSPIVSVRVGTPLGVQRARGSS